VQRIGKYKSFGDTFNRTSISEAQREVVSSLLMEASDFWADSVALVLNKTAAEVMQLWADTGTSYPLSHWLSLSASLIMPSLLQAVLQFLFTILCCKNIRNKDTVRLQGSRIRNRNKVPGPSGRYGEGFIPQREEAKLLELFLEEGRECN
jgi:hypothetical protein